jgi:two-component system CheB/CheR fusion protein
VNSPIDDSDVRDVVARLRSVVETAADGIITIDERGVIDSINPAGARMFGYQPNELIGRNVSMLMPEPHTSAHDGYMLNYLRTGHAKIIGVGRELQALRRDGTVFPMRLAVSEFNENGRRGFTGIVIDLSDRRRLERQVLDSVALEQRRIGQDLHDGVCQQLTATGFTLELLRRKAEKGEPLDQEKFRKLQQMLNESVAQLREVAHGLQPVHFRAGGLPEALRSFATTTSDRFHVMCRASCATGAQHLEQNTAEHLYRIAQEATSNAIRHGKAPIVLIRLVLTSDHRVALTVFDNGVGFSPAKMLSASGGMGLRIMKYRADAIGAEFQISPRRRNHGSVVSCTLRLPPGAPA